MLYDYYPLWNYPLFHISRHFKIHSCCSMFWNFSPFCGWITVQFVFPLICWWSFGLFCLLVTVKNATTNTGTQASVSVPVLNYFGYIPRSLKAFLQCSSVEEGSTRWMYHATESSECPLLFPLLRRGSNHQLIHSGTWQCLAFQGNDTVSLSSGEQPSWIFFLNRLCIQQSPSHKYLGFSPAGHKHGKT